MLPETLAEMCHVGRRMICVLKLTQNKKNWMDSYFEAKTIKVYAHLTLHNVCRPTLILGN